MGEDKQRQLRQILDAVRNPYDLAAAVLALAPSVALEDLEPMREAVLRLAAVDVELQRVAVLAIDANWEGVADAPAEIRKLLAVSPAAVRTALEVRLAVWFDTGNLGKMLVSVGGLRAANGGQHGAKTEGTTGGARPTRITGEETIPTMAGAEPDPPSPYVGFTDQRERYRILTDTTLQAHARYWLWFTISATRPDGAIDAEPAPLPAMPENTPLQVVLFAYADDLGIPPAGLCGWIRLTADGACLVDTQPPGNEDLELPAVRDQTTLFFPLRAPEPGELRLRCNIYYRANLLQSRLISARVTDQPEAAAGALRSELDYAISSSLDRRQLDGLGEQRLSLLLNLNPDDTHGLRFVGASDFRASSSIGEGTLTTAVTTARAALHRAAWESADPWDPSKKYHYSTSNDRKGADRKRLFDDLAILARAGWRLYFELCDTLAGEKVGRGQAADDASDKLQELMRTPGSVHIALRQGAKHVLPAAMLYDRFLDDQQDFTMCPAFAAALDEATPLADTPCFQGSCPSRALDTVVCPSGFWGFRHRLGLPINVDQGDDAPTSITTGTGTSVIMCVSDDFKADYQPHRDELAALGAAIKVTEDRNQALLAFGTEDDQIVYFFCHGAYTQSVPPVPALVLKKGGLVITASNLGNIRWTAPRSRPLVVMNGCHTAAHDPETILGFVDAFVKKCHAVGVIGTEITIFPSLARAFGQELFRAFLGGESIGEAVRQARLSLLHKQQNPLGLAYIPYVCNGVQLRGTPPR